MNKIIKLFMHSLPLAFGSLLSYLFWRSNYVLLVLYLAIVMIVLLIGEDRRIESRIFIFGTLLGIVIEIIGTQVSGYQSFTNPDWMGIPLWLPVSWGYGFILMKRVALILGNDSPWVRENKKPVE